MSCEPREPVGRDPIERLRVSVRGDWPRVILMVLVVGAILAASGGFSTASMPLFRRLLFWEGLVIAGLVLGRLASRVAVPRPWFETRPLTALTLMILVIGAPMSLLTALANSALRGQRPSLALLIDIAPSTLGVTAAITVLAFIVQARASRETHDAPAGAAPPRFLDRLPERLTGAELWAVQAEDHYLRLHTSKGSDLILMRLADAVAELEGIEGARTHRSWWVARAAVLGAERAEGRATLLLPGDLRAPVSRSFLPTLKDAGWLR